jgi:drug/metabolite transporter (DMT)-like permease
MADQHDNKGWLYFQAAASCMIWGAAYPFIKQLLSELSPLSIVTFRAVAGGLLLVLFGGARLSARDLTGGGWWRLLGLAFFGVLTQQYLQAWALKYTLASHAGWLIALTPIAVAALMALLGERVGPLKALAFALGFAGTLLVVFSQSGLDAFSLPSTKGDFIFLTTCAGWAFYVLCSKKWLTHWPQAKITAATMLASAAVLLPFWLAAGGPDEFRALSPLAWGGLAYLSVLATAVGYLFWNHAVEGLGGVKASYFIYLEPFSALLLAYFLLGERAAPAAAAGGLLIMAGVYLVGLKEGRRGLKGASINA